MAITKEVIIDVKSEKAVKGIDNVSKSVSNTDKELSKTKGSLSSVTGLIDSATGGMVSKFKNVTKTIGGVKNGFGALRGAIIATGIGALVVIVASLVEYFKNFEGGVKLVTQVMNTLAGTVNAIVDSFGKLLSGDFIGFFKGVSDGATEAWKNTDKLFLAQEKLFELNKKFIVENSKLNAEIESQGRIVRDTTRGYEERLEAQKELDRLSEQLIANERELNEAELERLQTELKLENNYEKRRELEIQIQETMSGLISTESRLAAQRDKAEKAQRQIIEDQLNQENARIEKAKEAAQKIAQERATEKKAILDIENNFKKQLEDLEDKTEEDRVTRAKSRALQQVNEMKGTEADKQKARLEIIAFYDAKEIELEKNKQKIKDDLEQKKQEQILAIQKSFEQKLEEQTDVTELQKLERQKERELLKLEELGATEIQKTELIRFYELQRTDLITKELKQREQLELDIEQNLLNAKKGALTQGLNILSQFAGKNKAIAMGIIAIQKGLAIADVVMGTQKEIAGISANPFLTTLPDLGLAIKTKAILSAKIRAGVSIASIMATGLGKTSGGAGGGGGASMGASGAPSVSAPQFNVIGTSGQNQIAQTLGQQQPIQAYVVSGNVSTAQSLDRNIILNASI